MLVLIFLHFRLSHYDCIVVLYLKCQLTVERCIFNALTSAMSLSGKWNCQSWLHCCNIQFKCALVLYDVKQSKQGSHR